MLLCKVELVLRLLERLDPGRSQPASGAWTLLSGYPFARDAGLATTSEQQWMQTSARHRVWDLHTRTRWIEALHAYREIPEMLRAYDVPADLGPTAPRAPSLAADGRLGCYDQALSALPDFGTHDLTIAQPGPHEFRDRSTRLQVDIPDELTTLPMESRTMTSGNRRVGVLRSAYRARS